MGDPLISLRGIVFSYPGGRRVLDGLDFTLGQGERVGITGPNGSGKTTLLHIMVGLLKPEAGEVEIFGKTRVEEGDFKEVRRRVGLLFQDPDDQLFCPTVIEDVAFGPLNLGKRGEELKGIVAEALRAVGLEGFEERAAHTLSGGEKRLASLATVLAMEPEVLLLDEPTAGLDEDTTEKVLQILEERGVPYVIVTHDREVLRRSTDRILRLNDGKLHPVR